MKKWQMTLYTIRINIKFNTKYNFLEIKKWVQIFDRLYIINLLTSIFIQSINTCSIFLLTKFRNVN